MPSDKFKRVLDREIDNRVREIRYGCNDCRKLRSVCPAHMDEVEDIILNPRKHITIRNNKVVRSE